MLPVQLSEHYEWDDAIYKVILIMQLKWEPITIERQK